MAAADPAADRSESPPARLGDRVEHAIEEHAAVEREIARGEAEAPSRGPRLRRTIFWLVVTGISLYLVAPSVLEVMASWKNIEELAPAWLIVMLVAQAAAIACLWALQHIAIAVGSWPAVATSQLAGNALAKVAPGGGALGAALQYRMLIAARV
ncbi:MAG TPA: UPF0104 family protein, partial [Solirubrobacteraceae bacterium]